MLKDDSGGRDEQNMTIKNLAGLALSIAFGSSAIAARDESPDWSCVTSLELPTHGLIAARAGSSGTVNAHLRLGENGKVSELRLTGDSPALEGEVRVAIELSKFARRCKGRTIDLIFSFTLEDPPGDSIIPPRTRFFPPNRFDLVFRKLKPSPEFPVPPAPVNNSGSY
jgi:hypothetical protein